MRLTIPILFLAPCFLYEIASAEVSDAGASGFTSINEVTVDAGRMAAWRAAIDEIDRWWSADHTVSGEASRLRIDATPQGCFCERLGKDAGVVHMTVTTVLPGTLLRLTGGLGPLGLMGVDGNMTWEFAAVENSTVVRFTYAVGGYRPGGLDALAGAVDGVLGEALLRLQAYIETGDAERIDLE
ncbi:MAG: ATPase [Woeseiaceae bacterium]|nr:ATPase [Woeseiaceae bacterium]